MQNSHTPAAEAERVHPTMSQLFNLRTHSGRFVWFALLLTALFSKALVDLVVYAANSDLHSYILLVPVISAYLIYIRRDQLPRTSSSSPGLAMIPLIGALAALALALGLSTISHDDYLTLIALSLLCLLAAAGFFFLGRKWMASASFPLAFLIFAVPLPDAMAAMLETASQFASTEAANLFFNLTGTPVMREGTIFQLPNIAIQVGQACSGIRSSLVLIITSLLMANLFLKGTWRRAALVCVVIPLGIIRNGFRVWVIATLCIHFGPQMIHSIIHRRGGPLFFVLSLVPLFLLLWWLRRGEERRERTASGP
jgi:exosortase C (VPDSG-CTERM-specific)